MIISGYDCWKRKGLCRRRKLESVGAVQIRGPEMLKVRLQFGWYQIVRSTVNLGFPTRMKFPLDMCHNYFPLGEILPQLRTPTVDIFLFCSSGV